jgi:hydrogenase/urease accessory protein HupE
MNRSLALTRPLALAAAASLLLFLLATPSALAHEVGLSRGEYAVAGSTVTAQLTFARRDVIGLVAGLDADHDGALTAAELAQDRDAINGALVARIKVTGDDVACPGELEEARLAEDDGVTLKATYRCPAAPQKVNVDVGLISDLPMGHRHLAHFDGKTGPSDAVISVRNRGFAFESTPGQAPSSTAPPKASYRGKLSFFPMGIEHILTGYDHLVFLLGLVIVGGRWRSLLMVVTAFTLAHSITLALAALGVWAPSPRIVEPAIALSIAYVGVENFFVKNAEKRWRITFPFGLIHGFGFAGALQEVAMPKADVPYALVLFNVGVEAGQLAVLALVLPLIYLLRKRAWFRDQGVKVISGAIAVAGVVWFVSRAFGLG